MSGRTALGGNACALLAVVSALSLAGCTDNESAGPALPGMTYESIQQLPDWSGWWQLSREEWQKSRSQLALKPELLAAFQTAAGSTDFSTDPFIFCRPQQFVGFNGRFPASVEFLFTPGRVTITNEAGLIRRIHTDGRSLPAEFDPSNTGTSIGHWEADTLVIETAGIIADAKYPGADPGAAAIGQHARVTERMRLKDRDTLQIDVETVAPDVLTGPDRRTILYARSDKRWPHEVINCVDNDRDFDPATGKQRFDLTPPADLPPPPPKP